MKRLAIAIVCATLAGCASLNPQRVDVPVAVACVKDLPVPPALVTDAELAAMSDYQLVIALFRDRLLRADYARELEAILQACRG